MSPTVIEASLRQHQGNLQSCSEALLATQGDDRLDTTAGVSSGASTYSYLCEATVIQHPTVQMLPAGPRTGVAYRPMLAGRGACDGHAGHDPWPNRLCISSPTPGLGMRMCMVFRDMHQE